MRKIVSLVLATLMSFSVAALASCGEGTGTSANESNKTDPSATTSASGSATASADTATSESVDTPSADETNGLPAWVTQTEGATTKVTTNTYSASDLTELYTKPSYTQSEDKTVLTYQPVTMGLQLDRDATEAFKSGAYIDLVIANSGEVEYDEVSNAVVAHSSVLRIYYYAAYNAMYFAYLNDNNGTLMWLPSDGTSALYTQWANDFVAGRKVYINYQFKDVFEEVDGELFFDHLEFTMYCGVEGENGEIAWLKEGCLYYPGQNCWIVADDGETYPENDASHLGHTMKTKQYVYGGYQQKDGYLFIGGGSKANFNLTVSDLSFTTEVTSEKATATTLPAWDTTLTVSASELTTLYASSFVISDTEGVKTYEPVTMGLQLDKDSTEAFKSGAYIDLVIANSGEVDYDEVSDAVVAHSSVLRIYYYANYNAMYFAYQNDNNGTLMWLPSDGTSALYTQWANDFVAGRKVYINYQFKDVYEQVDGEWYFAHLEFTMYCGVEGENGEIVWLKEGCLYYPGQNCWIVADDGETYPENDASHLGHTMKTKQYVYGGYKVKDGYVFIGGGSKADFKLTISDLSFTTTVTSETATAETLPAWTAAQTNE